MSSVAVVIGALRVKVNCYTFRGIGVTMGTFRIIARIIPSNIQAFLEESSRGKMIMRKVCGYTSIFSRYFFTKENNFPDFLLASANDKVLPKRIYSLKERI